MDHSTSFQRSSRVGIRDRMQVATPVPTSASVARVHAGNDVRDPRSSPAAMQPAIQGPESLFHFPGGVGVGSEGWVGNARESRGRRGAAGGAVPDYEGAVVVLGAFFWQLPIERFLWPREPQF